MKVIDFPGPPDPGLDELEAALHGELTGVTADSWRELRADVRSLTPSIDPDFQSRLELRLRDAPNPVKQRPRQPARRPWRAGGRPSPRKRLLLGGAAAAMLTVLIAVVLASSLSSSQRAPLALHPRFSSSSGATAARPAESAPAISVPSNPTQAHARVQELGASISLSASRTEVQNLAGKVGQLVVREGGFIQRSNVEVASEGSGEATLDLIVPGTKLTQTLAALARIAPVRAESQSLQDITGPYESSKRRLADAVAERAALLRALARAGTQGQIESLRRRLSLAGEAITTARANFQALSHRASSSSVEVTVLGDRHAITEGLTLRRGLHDAERVLSVTLIVLLIGLAGLVPALLLLAAALALAKRGRRIMRERALT